MNDQQLGSVIAVDRVSFIKVLWRVGVSVHINASGPQHTKELIFIDSPATATFWCVAVDQ